MMKLCGHGRVVADPELRETPNSHVVNFSLAFNERRVVNGEVKETAHFLNFEIWDKAAELMARMAKKGTLMAVEATPRQERWENDEGQKRSRIVFRVDNFRFLGNTVAKDKSEQEKAAEAAPF